MSSSTPLDHDWRDAFVISLRLRDAPPELISDQLALVQTHCAESGESAQEAFGDPTAYAAVVADESGVGDVGALREFIELLPVALGGFLATQLTFGGLLGVVQGTQLEMTVGDILAAVVLLGATFLLLRLLGADRSTAVLASVAGGAVAVAVLLNVMNTPVLTVVSPWPVLLVGLLVLAGVVLLAVRSGRRQQLLDPVDGQAMI